MNEMRRRGLIAVVPIVTIVGIATVLRWVGYASRDRVVGGSSPAGPELAADASLMPSSRPQPTEFSVTTSQSDAPDAELESEAQRQARAIIAGSRAAYAACQTYEDTGTYDLVFRDDGGATTRETEFRTAFAGPNAVRIAYRDVGDEYHGDTLSQLVAATDGVLEYSPWDGAPERRDSLKAAVGAMAGVSHGLTPSVLTLLPSGVEGIGALAAEHPTFTGAAELDGTTCDVIEGVETRADGTVRTRIRIWIAREDGLIRQRTEDDVQSTSDQAAQLKRLRAMRSQLLDAGLSEEDLDRSEKSMAGIPPLNTFEMFRYHPKCNEPIAPEALRATVDGSL